MDTKTQLSNEHYGSKWFQKNIKKIQRNNSLSERQLKILIQEAVTYYLIESITFTRFLEIIQAVEKRPEVQTLPGIKDILTQLLTLSKFASKPEVHREKIIETFYTVINKLLKDK